MHQIYVKVFYCRRMDFGLRVYTYVVFPLTRFVLYETAAYVTQNVFAVNLLRSATVAATRFECVS